MIYAYRMEDAFDPLDFYVPTGFAVHILNPPGSSMLTVPAINFANVKNRNPKQNDHT